jgi:hypothetical protein
MAIPVQWNWKAQEPTSLRATWQKFLNLNRKVLKIVYQLYTMVHLGEGFSRCAKEDQRFTCIWRYRIHVHWKIRIGISINSNFQQEQVQVCSNCGHRRVGATFGDQSCTLGFTRTGICLQIFSQEQQGYK